MLLEADFPLLFGNQWAKDACAKRIPSTKDVFRNKQNIFFLLRLHSILLGLDIINYSRLERVFFWIFIFDIIILLDLATGLSQPQQ